MKNRVALGYPLALAARYSTQSRTNQLLTERGTRRQHVRRRVKAAVESRKIHCKTIKHGFVQKRLSGMLQRL